MKGTADRDATTRRYEFFERAGGMQKRRLAREMAVQMLYQRDLGASEWPDVMEAFDPEEYLLRESRGESDASQLETPGARKEMRQAVRYARSLVRGTCENLETVDRLIRSQTENWRLERMPAVDRNILRLAVYELVFEAEVPKLVVVDEAIELAKTFGSERSSGFVNGLLDGLLKNHDFPGSLT